MATTGSPRGLSPAEIAEIPSPRLPISPQLSHLISEFTTLSIRLFTILSSPPSLNTSTLTAPIYESLSIVDLKLSQLVKLVAQHQQRQTRINELVTSLSTLSQSSHSSTTTLSDCISRLNPIIESGQLDRSSILFSSSTRNPLSADSLLSYARLLAPFTSAPPSSLYPPNEKLRGLGATDPTGRSLPPGAIPPFPTEGVMRRGRLQFGREVGGAGDGLGKTGEIGAPRNGHELHPSENGDATTTTTTNGNDQNATMDRLQFEAKEYESNHRTNGVVGSSNFATAATGNNDEEDEEEEEEEEEQFEFDLDLNPDL
ncbi:hypothetical protein JCM16303_005881 [Sporobolomyces ruberrimus]